MNMRKWWSYSNLSKQVSSKGDRFTPEEFIKCAVNKVKEQDKLLNIKESFVLGSFIVYVVILH